MIMIEYIPIKEYNYPLPETSIAKYPLEKRDETKLLVVNKGTITDSQFIRLHDFLPSESLLIFNNTKVIKARLIFHKTGGARIEIFCLSKENSGNGYAIWKCYVGNSKKWKNQPLEIRHDESLPTLTAERQSSKGDVHFIKFTWNDASLTFEEILELYGKVPLPPYIDREPVTEDRERYQTIYALYDGSVAAPTAGLHFTDRVFADLEKKGCTIDFVTLHVGAGTFKPVSADNAAEHEMHDEQIIVHSDTILRLIQNLQGTIIPVGTTSMRTLESIYWLGLQIITGNTNRIEETGSFFIDQWEPYKPTNQIPAVESLTAVYDYMKSSGLSTISGYTKIMIAPGYKFRICNALITNFHQPQSTLLLLVAAFIGQDWKVAYNHAVENNYRFLSYGDSCLFFKATQ